MNCKTCRSKIEEGELRECLSDKTREHLDACAPCRAFRDERVKLRELIGSLEQIKAPSDFDFHLRARLASERSQPHRSNWFPAFAPSVQAIALAAVFAAFVGAAAFLREIIPASNNASLNQSDAAMSANNQVPVAATGNRIVAPQTGGVGDEANAVADETLSPLSTGLNDGRGRSRLQRALGKSNPARSIQSVENAALRALANDFNASDASNMRHDALIPLAVNASAQSARVWVDDGRGTSHMISLEPVTFGAQDMIERRPAMRSVATNNRGVW